MIGFLWAGCTGTDPEPTTPAEPEPDAVSDEIHDASAAASDEVGTVAWVSWTTDLPGTSWVSYARDGETPRTTPITATAATEHHVAVIGLAAGQTYTLVPHTRIDGAEQVGPGLVHTAGPRPAVPAFTITDYDPARVRSPDDLFVLGQAGADTGWVLVVDRAGAVVWFREAVGAPATLVQSPKIGLDRQSLLWAEWDRDKQVDLGSIVRLRTDGTGLEQTPAPFVHHDFFERDDGSFTWLTTDIRDVGADEVVLSDRVVTTDLAAPDGMAQLFSYFDDYPEPFAVPCEHGAATRNWGLDSAYEWTHTNSMVYDADEDAYWLDVRFFDALLKIDRATGDILWQLGGRNSDFTTPAGDPVWTDVDTPVLWSHGHFSHAWEGGFLMFDNGDHHPVARSRVAEYAVDEVARTVEEVWSWEPPPGDETFVRFLGDAKKLDNGNVLIVWSDQGELTEVTPDGDVVWRLRSDSCCFGRGQIVTDLYELRSPIRPWR